LKSNKVLGLLGLAMKGRRVAAGEFQTENAVKDGSAMLVIVAEDASDNTKKLFCDKCSFYNIPIIIYGTKEVLGNAIGRAQRSSLAVLDAGLARAIEKEMRLND